MARKGRDLEILISNLEKMHLPGAVINSPDFIEDKITGQSREVDISIRSNIGTTEVLIIIECRDRADGEDVTWIEQLHTKTQDVKANKVIAVSSSGFSQPAIKKAVHCGIETRTFKEVTSEYISNWFKPQVVEGTEIKFDVISFGLQYEKGTVPIEFAPIRLSDKVLIRTSDNEVFSVLDIIGSSIQPNDIRKLIPIDGNFHELNFTISFLPGRPQFTTKFNDESLKLVCIEVIAKFQGIQKDVPISKITSYEGTDGTVISQTIELDSIVGGGNKVQLIKDKDGGLKIKFNN